MSEIEKKIQHAKNSRQSLFNEIAELQTRLRVKEAERSMVDSFIDMLNDLKSKTADPTKGSE